MQLRVQAAVGAPDTSGTTPFLQDRGGAMRLEMGRIGHQPVGLAALGCERGEDANMPIRLQRTKQL